MNDSAERARALSPATKMLTGRLACVLTGALAAWLSSQAGVSAAPTYAPDLLLAKRSAAGPYSYTGRLLVRDTNGQNLGFVRRNLQDDGTVRADFGNVCAGAPVKPEAREADAVAGQFDRAAVLVPGRHEWGQGDGGRRELPDREALPHRERRVPLARGSAEHGP